MTQNFESGTAFQNIFGINFKIESYNFLVLPLKCDDNNRVNLLDEKTHITNCNRLNLKTGELF